MINYNKKYVVNVDFPTYKSEGGHKIHLNPYYETSSLKEKILRHYDPKGYKIQKDGGPIYLTRDEAQECLKGGKTLVWQGKPVNSLRPCELCKRFSEWNI